MSRLRKGNLAEAITNSGVDNTVIDGVCVAQDLVDLGTKMGRQTIEALSKMYPKNQAYEQIEEQLINDENFVAELRAANKSNEEKIEAHYKRTQAQKAIKETNQKIANDRKKAEKEGYQAKISELSNTIENLTKELNNLKTT